jgi:hypothetical protein
MPMSLDAKRPLLDGSAYTVRKENRASGWRYSTTCGAVLRRVVSTSRRVASFLWVCSDIL